MSDLSCPKMLLSPIILLERKALSIKRPCVLSIYAKAGDVKSKDATLARFLYGASIALVPIIHLLYNCFMVSVTKFDSPCLLNSDRLLTKRYR